MIFSIVAKRELKGVARRKATYRVRFFGALIASIFFLFAVGVSFTATNTGGQGWFWTCSFFLMAICAFEGIRCSTESLIEEKRNGTLGLLFLTDLKGKDVIMGKVGMGSVTAFYVLLGVLPIMGMSLLLGGVTWGMFWRVSLALGTFLGMVIAIGIFFSSVCWRSARAFFGTLLTVGAFLMLPPFLGIFLDGYFGPSSWKGIYALSPVMVLRYADEIFYQVGDRWVYWSGILHMAFWGMAFFGLASWYLEKNWNQSFEKEAGSDNGRQQKEGKSDEKTSVERNGRRAELDINPISWLTRRQGRFTNFDFYAMVTLSVVVLLITLLIDVEAIRVGLGVLYSLFFLWLTFRFTFQSAQVFAESRSEGALDILVTTPITISEIVSGHARAVWRHWGKPLGFLAFIQVVMSVLNYQFMSSIGMISLGLHLVSLVTSLIGMVGLFIALFWVAAWLGLRTGRVVRATMSAFGLCLILPFIVQWLIQVLSFALLLPAGFGPLISAPWIMQIIGSLVTMGIYTGEALWARRSLLRNFRTTLEEVLKVDGVE